MILGSALIAIGVFSVLWRRDLLGGLLGIQLLSFGLATLAFFAAAKNGHSALGSWYGLSILVGGLVGVSMGFALAARRLRIARKGQGT